MNPSFVKFIGPNNQQVAVKRHDVLFLEEGLLGAEKVCNIHFQNGRWVSVLGSVDEVDATLNSTDEQDSKDRVEEWKQRAKAQREACLEVEKAMEAVNVRGKIKSYRSEVLEDKTRKIEIVLEPEAFK